MSAALNARSDEALAAQVADGDAAALRALYLRYWGPTFHFLLRRTRNRGLAQDLAQETFTRVWLKADTFDHQGRFRGWLFTIALNLTRSELGRRRGVLVPVEREAMENVGSDDACPHALLERSEEKRRVAQAVARLTPRLREVVVLKVYRQLSFGEIAQLTRASEGALKLRYHRAVTRLRDRLNPR